MKDFFHLKNFLSVATILCAVILFFLSFRFHLTLIATESPQEYRENTFVALTDFMLTGGKPYTAEAMPAYMNVYGILYPAIVFPFAKLFGSTYFLHRTINAVFLFLTCGILYGVIRRIRLERWKTITLLTTWYTTLLLTTFDVISRSDGLGIFLFMMTLTVPWWGKFSRKSLLIAGISTILSFYAKQYFVLGGIFLALYLFLFRSKKSGVLFASGVAAGFLVSAITVQFFMPYYFFNTVLFHLKNARYLVGHLINQIQEFSYIQSGFLLLMIMFAGFKLSTQKNIGNVSSLMRRFNFSSWGKSLVQASPNYWAVSFVFAVLVVVGKLGGHDGNFLSYFVELIGPLLLICTAFIWKWYPNEVVSGLCVLGTLGILIMKTQQFGIEDTKVIHDNWQEWETIISECQDAYVAGPFVRIARENGSNVYDAGHAEYFTKPITKFAIPTFPDPRPVFNVYLHELERKISGKEFDCIVRIRNYTSYDYLYTSHLLYFTEQNYDLSQVKPLRMYYHQALPFEVWKRK